MFRTRLLCLTLTTILLVGPASAQDPADASQALSLPAHGRHPVPDAPLPTSSRLADCSWTVSPPGASPEVVLPAIQLENDYLRAVVVPSRGGRLVSLIDKFSRRPLLTGGGVGFAMGGEDAPAARPVAWRMTADGDRSVSVWVGCTDTAASLRWAVEYRLPSELAALYSIVRADNVDTRAVDAAWSLAAEYSTTPGGQPLSAPAGVQPASGGGWAFSGYFDPASDSGVYALFSAEVEEGTRAEGVLRARARPARLIPGGRHEWVVQWVGLHGIGAPAWMAPDLAAGFALHGATLEVRWGSFRFLNWLRLAVQRDGALLFEQPWLLQPDRPSSFLFPLTHPGQDLVASVEDWGRSRALCRLQVKGATAPPSTPPTVERAADADVSEASYARALELLSSGSTSEAIAALQSIPFGSDYSSAALAQLAQAAASRWQPELAAQMATASLLAAPGNTGARALRAYLYRRLQRTDDARADLFALLGDDPLTPFVAVETVFWSEPGGGDRLAATAQLEQLFLDPATRAWTAACYAAWGATREAQWVHDFGAAASPP